MIAFLLALAPFIPSILSLAGFAIKLFGASEKDLQAYADMVQKNKDSGLITVETYERLKGYREELKREANADTDTEEKK